MKIEEYYPPGYDDWHEHRKADTPRIMFCVWNGHALFYTREAANAITHMRKSKPVYDKPYILMKHPSQTFKQLTFDEMQPYSITALDEAYEAQKTCTLYVLTAVDLKRVETDLKLRGFTAAPRMRDSRTVDSYTIHRPRSRIRIRQLPADVEKLQAIAKAFEQQTGFALPYHGDTLPSLMRRLVDEHQYYRRRAVPKTTIARLMEARGGLCELCGDAGEEVHHKNAVCLGGGNSLDNLQLLCAPCHAKVTEGQHLQRKPRLQSCFSPELAELFYNTPKPQQIHWGIGGTAPVQSLDINGCRRNCLHTDDAPSFAFTDELEPYDMQKFSEHHSFWVDIGVDLTDDPCCERPCERCHGTGLNAERLAVAPYDGPHLYPRVAVKYLMDLGIVRHEHIAWAITASRSVPRRELEHTLAVVEQVVGKVDGALVKEAVLSLIGLWGKPFGTRWRVFHTNMVSDVGNVTSVGELSGQVVLKSHSVMLTNHSYMPIAHHVLWQEAVWMHQIGTVVIPLGVRGSVVDNYFIDSFELCPKCQAAKEGRVFRSDEVHECANCKLRAILPLATVKRTKGQLTYPGALFKIEQSDPTHIPRCPQKVQDHSREAPEPIEWTTIREDETEGLENCAALIAQNRGGFVDAPPGCGKTRGLLPKIEEQWMLEEPEAVFHRLAPTHVASSQMAGYTVQGGLCHGYDHHSVLIVDEVSMLSEELLERLARWSLVGARFVFLGDFCQLLPVGQGETRWRMEDSRVFKYLCNGLRICLTKNRRAAGDPEHFQRILELRSRVGVLDRSVVDAFLRHYPWNGERISYYLCMSHHTRMRINHRENSAEAAERDKKLFVPSCGEMKGCSSQPQDMWIWEGMQLIGAGSGRKVLNGVLYIVESYTDTTIKIRPHEDFKATAQQVSLAEAAACLRLCYAAVYYSCQGRTLKEQHVMLLDTDHPHFSLRHLYVGASRVQHSMYLHSNR